MIEIDINNIPESTVNVTSKEVIKVLNVLSFQNLSRNTICWSTTMTTSDDVNARVDPGSERIFSNPTTVYFKNTDRKSIAKIFVRNINL